MNEFMVPSSEEISTMSWDRCQYDRIRRRNELSFALGEGLWGGRSDEQKIAMLKAAIKALDQHYHDLAGREVAF